MMETALGLSTFGDWFQATGTIGLLFIATKFLLDNRRLRMAAKKDDREGYGDLIDRLVSRVGALETLVARLEADIADCREKHAEERARRMELEAVLLGLGEGRKDAARIVAIERMETKQAGGAQ